MLQITDIDHILDSAINRLCVVFFFLFFFKTFFAVFHDLLFGCLHKQSISIKNVLSSRVVTLHSVVGNGHISPFSRQ